MSRIAATPPSVVILDSTDPGVVRHCPLGKLLGSAPELKVICLDLEQAQIQLVASERHPAANVHDLVGVIDPPI